MKCVVNWISLRIRVRSTNTQPHLTLNKIAGFESLTVQNKHEFVKSQRSLDFYSFGKCFPPDPKKKVIRSRSGHVRNLSWMSVRVVHQTSDCPQDTEYLGIPGNQTGSGVLRTPRTGPDGRVRHRTFQPLVAWFY